jgi:hypothetical protein
MIEFVVGLQREGEFGGIDCRKEFEGGSQMVFVGRETFWRLLLLVK